MSAPIIRWDTPFGPVKLSTHGTGSSGTASASQNVVDLFGEGNARVAHISKRMIGFGDQCGTTVRLEHDLTAETRFEVADSDFMHAIRLTRGETSGWLALQLMERNQYKRPHNPNRNSPPLTFEPKSLSQSEASFHIRHESNCKIAIVKMLYVASTSNSLKIMPNWFFNHLFPKENSHA